MGQSKINFEAIGLYQDMLATIEVVREFKFNSVIEFCNQIQLKKQLLVTGEGSSRIFPAKNMIYKSKLSKSDITITTEGACQACEYDLTNTVVFGVSNSGKTKELVYLFDKLNKQNHPNCYALVANADGPIEARSKTTKILTCGSENAVAATKSVVEQALFFECLYLSLHGKQAPDFQLLASQIEEVVINSIPTIIIEAIANAETVYFAGRNNGVAEELTLKTNEIIRKKSAYLEGTYAIHGIEEVLNEKDIIILIDPFEQEEINFKNIISDKLGVQIIAISSHKTLFPTLQLPVSSSFENFLQLAIGWRLLLEVGCYLGIDVDRPIRARKIGNEFAIV